MRLTPTSSKEKALNIRLRFLW